MTPSTFTVASDLHLDISEVFPSFDPGEFLVLAGDLCEADSLEGPSIRDYLGYLSEKFQTILYVMGNHDHYSSVFQRTAQKLREKLPRNFLLLDNETVEIGDTLFMGCTLWTDCNQRDPVTLHFIRNYMADFTEIVFKNDRDDGRLFRPEDCCAEFHKAVRFLERNLAKNPDRKTVVVTHHCPTYVSVHPDFRHERAANGGFCSDLSDLILDNPQIRYWVCGHTHHFHRYMVGDATEVVCNPWGYRDFNLCEQSGFVQNLELNFQ
jgi:predicted phosphohydrolase